MHAAFSSFGKAMALTAVLIAAAVLAIPARADFYCDSLTAQLAALPRGEALDPGRTNAIVQELNRAQWEARRFNCTFRFLGPPPHPLCRQINGQIAQLKAQLRGSLGGGSSWGGSNWGGGSFGARAERQRILNAMASYRCPMPQQGIGSGGYRTLCVRTCDGYYFPISFSTGRSRLKTDEAACQSMYPEGEAELYVHRSIGAESDQAVSLKGQRYADQPFAFAYNKQFTPACKSLLTVGLASLAERFAAAQAEKLAADAKAGKDGRRDGKGHLVTPPPIPIARPAPGEDPETLANREGEFVIEPADSDPVATVDLDEEKPVRIVGGFFYALPTEEETARMMKLRHPPRPIATDKPPVAADMVPPPADVRGALTGEEEPKIGLP